MEPKPSKTKKLFGGLRGKKKKKSNAGDLVLANKGALESGGQVAVPGASQQQVEEEVIDPLDSLPVRDRVKPNYKRAPLKTQVQEREAKPQSFQIAINITEARQLMGENIDPSVVIEIGDEKKQTSTKQATNAPFYNEYFVFDFFAHREVFFDKVIKLTVTHTKMLKSFCLGSFKVDVWTVYKQPGHQFINKWATLTNPGDSGVKGYVKVDISVSTKGEAMQPGQKASDADEQISKNLLIPEGFPAERPWARFCVKVYRAEGLPKNNSGVMASMTKAFIGDNTALIDPYVVVSFFKNQGRTSTQKNTAAPEWNEQIVFVEMFPPLCQRFKLQVWDEGSMNDIAIGTHSFDLKRISNEQDGDKGFLPTFGPSWINLYGAPRSSSLGDDTAELNEGIGEGVSYRGRVYMELSVEILSGGAGSISKLKKPSKAQKDAKGGKGGKDAKDGKAPAAAAGAAAADEDKGKGAEVLPVEDPPVPNPAHEEKFMLFGAVFEATMIDRKIGDKPINFEFSMGNYGNVLEAPPQPSGGGRTPGLRRKKMTEAAPSPSPPPPPPQPTVQLPTDEVDPAALSPVGSPLATPKTPTSPKSPISFVDPASGPSSPGTPRSPTRSIPTPSGTAPSTPTLTTPLLRAETPEATVVSKSITPPEKPLTVEGNRQYMYLPIEKQKPCVNVQSIWENRTYRLHNSNMLENIAILFEEGLAEVTELLKKQDPGAEMLLRTVLKEFCGDARNFITMAEARLKAELKKSYFTQLDKKRLTLCKQELESLIEEAMSLARRKIKADGMKEMLQSAKKLVHNLRFLVLEPQHTMSDVFVWLLSNNKRVAYARVRARDLLFSSVPEARGTLCGKIITLFLKLPKRVSGFPVQAQLDVYLWLGPCSDSIHMLDDLPAGFSLPTGGADASSPPTSLLCPEQHQFQLRCHMYQARGLIAADNTGLSDPFARVTYLSHSQTTKVINQTLSPTWNQCLQMNRLLLSGDQQQIQREPPSILIELYDDDALGAAEYLGATVAVPEVRLSSDPYTPPTLKYSPLHCGSQSGGDLLAAFELLQIPTSTAWDLPKLEEHEGGIYTVPANIRPVLSTYRLEVLFWGLRELKKVQLLSVDRPQVFIECAGKTLRSSVIQKYKANPNFTELVDAIELELPENEHLHPPLSITVVDWRAFGRSTLVGNHVVNNLKGFKYVAPPPLPPATPAAPAETPGPSSAASTLKTDRHSSTGLQQDPGETGSTVALMDKDCLITMEEEPARPPPPPPPAAPPSPKMEAKKKRDRLKSTRSTKRKKRTIADESAECVIDWWTKYYASVQKEAKLKDGTFPQVFEKASSPFRGLLSDGIDSLVNRSERDRKRLVEQGSMSSKHGLPSKVATLKLYNKELEAEFGPFNDWVNTFELYRGKATEEEGSNDERLVGKFKGRFSLCKLMDEDEDWEEGDLSNLTVNRGIPPNNLVQVLVRVYVISASNLHPADPDGKADPYIFLKLGKSEIKDRDNYIPKQLNPMFGRSFEMQVTFPQDSLLLLQVFDFDLVGGDDLIGETRIDLENRFYSRHRATCGLPAEYSIDGYNAWRDCLKPSELLTKMCKDNGVDGPYFRPGRITVAGKVFAGKTLYVIEEEPVETYEHLSLKILHRWGEIPGGGCRLVPEHIETRTLYHKARPGMDQGQVQMWVDMFPMEMPHPGPPVDISPRKPKGYELRIIIWNTEDVILEDSNFITGQASSDIYVKGWLKGLEDDKEETDVHHNSLTGEGNFNWRFVFPFNYMPAERVLVVKKRESIFSLDKTEKKLPPMLLLQVWDFETLSFDDFLGTLELDLHGFPRGAKTAKACKMEMMNDGVDKISIFQQKRARGWWPFSKGGELTGKLEAEFHLLIAEDAEKNPVGKARKEPEPLPKPNRPDTSFSWFVNPFKCFFHLIWKNYKKYIIIGLVILITALFLALLFYTLPAAISQKMVNG